MKPLAVAVAAAVLALAPCGARGAAAADPAGVEQRAAQILRSALTHLAESPSFRIRSEVLSETVLPSGQRLHYPGRLELAVRRPDQLWYKFESEQRRVSAWYDGKKFTLLDNEKNTCASTFTPRGLGPLFDDMTARLGFTPPLSILLREDNVAMVLPLMTSGFYVGREELHGTVCHHLAFRQQNVDLEFWVAAEGAPLLKQVVIVQKQLPARPQFSYAIVGWEPGVALDDALFRFEPPQDVIFCDFESLAR